MTSAAHPPLVLDEDPVVRGDAVHVRSGRGLIDVVGQPEQEVGERMPGAAAPVSSLKRNTPKSSAPVKFTGLVQLYHLMSTPPLNVWRPRTSVTTSANWKLSCVSGSSWLSPRLRVAGDVDGGVPGDVGRAGREQGQPECADEIDARAGRS